MFAWIRELGQRRHLQEVARLLQDENERLRDENARVAKQVEACQEILAVLVEATEKAESILEQARAGEDSR
jgi:hypothetical protein